MNAAPSADRLPPSIRQAIEADPCIRTRLASGMLLKDILSSADWASHWADRADDGLRQLLGWLLRRYAAIPFEEVTAESEGHAGGGFTGAEIRVGLARLRLCGVLFAIRKTWGERLYYIPTDMVAEWQRLILPAEGEPLTGEEEAQVEPVPSPFRLPLSLELLAAWSYVGRCGLPLTAKGAVAKPAATRMAADMRLTPEELAPLELVHPNDGRLPPSLALAFDLGLADGVLHKRQQGLYVSAAGLSRWLLRSASEAEAELHRLTVERYAASQPAMHLAACTAAARPHLRWFPLRQMVDTGIDSAALNTWLSLLASFGWAERGVWHGTPVFRLLFPFIMTSSAQHAADAEEQPFYVQPDGEIFVPPEVGPAARWTLEQIAERVAADRVFVYRLSRDSMANAVQAGYDMAGIRAFLENGSGSPLPEPVRESLVDWFSRLGRLRFEEVTLLRTDSVETARRLLEQPEAGACVAERLGDRDFIIGRNQLKDLKRVLDKMGYSTAVAPRTPDIPLPAAEPPAPPDTGDDRAPTGWIVCRPAASLYQPDRTLPQESEWFPGLTDIPQTWLSQPGAYHVSTRREMIRRAIAWRTALRVEEGERQSVFVPLSLDVNGDEWEVRGRWKRQAERGEESSPSKPHETVTLSPDRLSQLMIMLPEWEPVTGDG